MIAEIIIKKLKGHLNEKEEILFKKWLAENDENFLNFQRLRKLQHDNIPLPNIGDLNSQEAWKRISTTRESYRLKTNYISYKKLIKYAAVFIGLMGCFLFYVVSNKDEAHQIQLDPNVITLELGNGEKQILSEGGASVIIDPNGHLLGKKGDGLVDYSQNEIYDNEDKIVQYNTIRIPNGKTFKIVLSDGTMVNLNAGSSLKYPVKFISGQNREVTLTGEAFFDVKKNDSSPFIVTTGTMDVRVLGTKFNLTSYPEDLHQSTVLVEGSVKLYETGKAYDNDDSILLSPGFKADWDASDKKMTVNEVNTDIYTGWIEGKLVMKKMTFSNIIQRLQRHYNVSISNEYKELNDRIFTATFEKETIEEVLETFTIETPFEYEINGTEIKIKK